MASGDIFRLGGGIAPSKMFHHTLSVRPNYTSPYCNNPTRVLSVTGKGRVDAMTFHSCSEGTARLVIDGVVVGEWKGGSSRTRNPEPVNDYLGYLHPKYGDSYPKKSFQNGVYFTNSMEVWFWFADLPSGTTWYDDAVMYTSYVVE